MGLSTYAVFIMPDDSLHVRKVTDFDKDFELIEEMGGTLLGTPSAYSEKDAIDYTKAVCFG